MKDLDKDRIAQAFSALQNFDLSAKGGADIRFLSLFGATMRREFDAVPCGTMATDSKTLYVNRDFLHTLSDFEVQYILLHECYHAFAGHCHRLRFYRGTVMADLAHPAADYATNGFIDSSTPFECPKHGLKDERFIVDGAVLNMEQIAKILFDEQQQDEQQPDDSQDDNQDDSSQGNGSSDQDDQSGDQQDDQSESGQSGNGAGETFADQFDTSAHGELLPAPENCEENEDEIDAQIAMADKLVKAAGGKLSDHLSDAIKARQPKRDPMDAIRTRLQREFDNSDYSMRKPNQRYAFTGCIMPSMKTPGIGHIMLAVDVSGSMSGEKLEKAGDGVVNIVREFNARKITVVEHQSKITKVYEIDRGQHFECPAMWAGGGTRFKPVCELAEELQIDGLLWLTDCCPLDETFTQSYSPQYPVWFLNCDRIDGARWYERDCKNMGEFYDISE